MCVNSQENRMNESFFYKFATYYGVGGSSSLLQMKREHERSKIEIRQHGPGLLALVVIWTLRLVVEVFKASHILTL